MKRKIKMSISVILCVAMCFSFLPIRAFANTVDNIYSIVPLWNLIHAYYMEKTENEWSNFDPLYNIWLKYSEEGQALTAENLSSAYSDYVSDLPGTLIDSAGAFKYYYTPNSYYNISAELLDIQYGETTIVQFRASDYNGIRLDAPTKVFNFPFAAQFTYFMIATSDKTVDVVNGQASTTVAANTNYETAGGFSLCTIRARAGYQIYTAHVQVGYKITPTSGTTTEWYNSLAANRMTSIVSTLYSTNNSSTTKYEIGTVENNTVTNVYETNVFNETTNVFTEPSSGTTYNITNWTYDYSTRTYVCKDSSNNTYTVQYGDDCIYVTVPNGSGGTTTTPYYYVRQTPAPTPGQTTDPGTFPNPSSDDYTDDPSTTGGFWSTIWKAFKDGLSSLIAGIIKGLFSGLKAIITGILNVFSGIITKFLSSASDFFNSFGENGVSRFWSDGVVTDLS